MDEGMTRVVLYDTHDYELERKLRDFRHEHSLNSFVFAVFDCCRTILSTSSSDLKGVKN